MSASEALTLPRRQPAPREAAPPVSNARIAMIVLIAGESMLFAGLIGTYLVFRLSAPNWPPPDLPRLPLGMTSMNTIALLASVVPMSRALAAARRHDRRAVGRATGLTTLLGVVFLAVQGAEWVRLVRHGLTLGSGTYGATFYTLIGCHGLHVLVAVTWLTVMAALVRRGALSRARRTALEMCGMYWYFVCGLWVILFPLVYLY